MRVTILAFYSTDCGILAPKLKLVIFEGLYLKKGFYNFRVSYETPGGRFWESPF
jgi:hypothetical protein